MKTSIDLKVVYTWSRMHSNRNNFLTITQVAHVLIPGTPITDNSVTITGNKITELKNGYKTEELKDKNTHSLNASFIKECMVDNIATKSYKYFKVIFANGSEIVCTSYEEFGEIIDSLTE